MCCIDFYVTCFNRVVVVNTKLWFNDMYQKLLLEYRFKFVYSPDIILCG